MYARSSILQNSIKLQNRFVGIDWMELYCMKETSPQKMTPVVI